MPYGTHSVACHPAEMWIPPLPSAETGTRFSNSGGMQGCVDLCYVKSDRLGLEPVTCQSQVQHPTVAPTRNNVYRINGGQTKNKKIWLLPIIPSVNWVHSICKWDFLSGIVSALLEQNIVVNTCHQECGEQDDKRELPTYSKSTITNLQKI